MYNSTVPLRKGSKEGMSSEESRGYRGRFMGLEALEAGRALEGFFPAGQRAQRAWEENELEGEQ